MHKLLNVSKIFKYFVCIYVYNMPTMHIFRSKKGRTLIPVPAWIRDELNLQNKDEVEVKRIGKKIIVTKKETENK